MLYSMGALLLVFYMFAFINGLLFEKERKENVFGFFFIFIAKILKSRSYISSSAMRKLEHHSSDYKPRNFLVDFMRDILDHI